jgi:cysteine-rich repeat protein
VCGNGTPEGLEQCDDGNNVSGDGCRNDCTRESCGDGTLDPGEECDDGDPMLVMGRSNVD